MTRCPRLRRRFAAGGFSEAVLLDLRRLGASVAVAMGRRVKPESYSFFELIKANNLERILPSHSERNSYASYETCSGFLNCGRGPGRPAPTRRRLQSSSVV